MALSLGEPRRETRHRAKSKNVGVLLRCPKFTPLILAILGANVGDLRKFKRTSDKRLISSLGTPPAGSMGGMRSLDPISPPFSLIDIPSGWDQFPLAFFKNATRSAISCVVSCLSRPIGMTETVLG